MTAFAAAPTQLGVAECTQPGAPTPPQTPADVAEHAIAMAASNAGVPIPANADVACVECAVPRSLDPEQVWRWGWSGEPLCEHCATVLELAGELRGVAALRAEP